MRYCRRDSLSPSDRVWVREKGKRGGHWGEEGQREWVGGWAASVVETILSWGGGCSFFHYLEPTVGTTGEEPLATTYHITTFFGGSFLSVLNWTVNVTQPSISHPSLLFSDTNCLNRLRQFLLKKCICLVNTKWGEYSRSYVHLFYHTIRVKHNRYCISEIML